MTSSSPSLSFRPLTTLDSSPSLSFLPLYPSPSPDFHHSSPFPPSLSFLPSKEKKLDEKLGIEPKKIISGVSFEFTSGVSPAEASTPTSKVTSPITSPITSPTFSLIKSTTTSSVSSSLNSRSELNPNETTIVADSSIIDFDRPIRVEASSSSSSSFFVSSSSPRLPSSSSPSLFGFFSSRFATSNSSTTPLGSSSSSSSSSYTSSSSSPSSAILWRHLFVLSLISVVGAAQGVNSLPSESVLVPCPRQPESEGAEYLFSCKTSWGCVHHKYVCDKIPHCEDASDEHSDLCGNRCLYWATETKGYKCQSRECVPFNVWCDWVYHCRDGSDENNCPQGPPSFTKRPGPCLPGEEVSCGDGECLPIHLRCDGTPDCWTAKDEEDCDVVDRRVEMDGILQPTSAMVPLGDATNQQEIFAAVIWTVLKITGAFGIFVIITAAVCYVRWTRRHSGRRRKQMEGCPDDDPDDGGIHGSLLGSHMSIHNAGEVYNHGVKTDVPAADETPTIHVQLQQRKLINTPVGTFPISSNENNIIANSNVDAPVLPLHIHSHSNPMNETPLSDNYFLPRWSPKSLPREMLSESGEEAVVVGETDLDNCGDLYPG